MNVARTYPLGRHLLIRVPRWVMLVKTYIPHPKKAGRAGRKARSTGRRSIALDRAVLDLLAVSAFAIALMICAALGEGDGVSVVAGALVVVLKLRAESEGKLR